MIPYHKDEYEDIKIQYYLDKPFIEIFHNKNFSKLQEQLLYLLILDNYTGKIRTKPNSPIIIEMIQFIVSEAYSNLFKSAARNNFILLSNFIIAKNLITETTLLNSFSNTELLFENKIHYLISNNKNIELCEYYSNLLNKNVIFTHTNIFPISNFAKIIKYPLKVIDKHFNEFNWEHKSVIKTQQLPLEIYIKHIESLSDYTFDLLTTYLPENEINTLLLIKEMI